MRNHLRIAYGSAIETGDLLELLQESGLFEEGATSELVHRCDKSQKFFTGLLKRYGWLNYTRVRVETG